MKERVQFLLSKSAHEVMHQHGRLFEEVWRELTNESICGKCPKDIYASFMKLKKMFNQNSNDMPNCNYKLKDNVRIYVNEHRNYYTNHNLTDEVAELILSMPGNRDKFAVIAPKPQETTEPKVNASPAARKLAAERGIDLSVITGTGANGFITKGDVENAA